MTKQRKRQILTLSSLMLSNNQIMFLNLEEKQSKINLINSFKRQKLMNIHLWSTMLQWEDPMLKHNKCKTQTAIVLRVWRKKLQILKQPINFQVLESAIFPKEIKWIYLLWVQLLWQLRSNQVLTKNKCRLINRWRLRLRFWIKQMTNLSSMTSNWIIKISFKILITRALISKKISWLKAFKATSPMMPRKKLWRILGKKYKQKKKNFEISKR